MSDLIIVNAREIITCAGHSRSPARGSEQGDLGSELRSAGNESGGGAAVGVRGAAIHRVGARAELSRELPDARIVDAGGGVVLPGFVDCHTHLVFAGDRAGEWEERMQGVPYLDILRAGGGIRRTVRATREASEVELLSMARRWMAKCLEHGTTTIEIKSGYGLDRETEKRILRVARQLSTDREGAQRVVATYLGAHVVPSEIERAAYVDLVVDLLPELRAEGLCDFVDVFCEEEAFSTGESERILSSARDLGFGLKIHAEQFTATGAAALGANLGAASVDHLEHADDVTIAALARSSAVAVLLPAVAFHLGMRDAAPARALVSAGVPVALATDFNPGSSFTPSMPMVIALATRTLGLSVAECIVACTINAAHALGLGAEVGSLEPGKRADVLILDVPDHRWLGYAFGTNPVSTVIANGEVVASARVTGR